MHQKTGHLVPFHERIHIHICERPFLAASSTDRCNTFCELLSRRLIEQGLSRPFIELPCDGTVRAPVPAPPRTIAFPRSFLVLTETRVFPAMMEELQDGANCAQV